MTIINKKPTNLEGSWSLHEFGGVDCGDARLTGRLVKIVGDFVKSPESSINKASGSWAEAKAAYRFFQNDHVKESEILASHIKKTRERSGDYQTILSIQDTSYMSYKNHKKTEGLGVIASRIRSEKTNFKTPGLVMHTAFAITTDGLPIGLLDQKIHSRPPLPAEIIAKKKKSHGRAVSIEDKESIKWLESLKKSKEALEFTNTQVITVCDREADMYDFFDLSNQIQSPVLVRAHYDRVVNKQPHSYKRPKENKPKEKLWECIKKLSIQGHKTVDIPSRNNKPARTALLCIRFGSFTMDPPRNNFRSKTETLPFFTVQAVYVIENNPPEGVEPLEWMLLTNLPVDSLESALEKVHWYTLRWRIEIFHKILKSGLYVEKCRLGTAQRLIRYLTVMSIIAWRLFYMTLLERTAPELPCTVLLGEEEWKVLYTKMHHTRVYPSSPPSIKEAMIWIARLGGFLARKNDGEPGPMTLWRGWKHLSELIEGWNLACAHS